MSRRRSSARSKDADATAAKRQCGEEKALAALRAQLECGICCETMFPPIRQCANGHTLCDGCSRRVDDTCPQCRSSPIDIRCRALEQAASELRFPCVHAGCTAQLAFGSVQAHAQSCDFQYAAAACPFGGCKAGLRAHGPLLLRHLRTVHQTEHIDLRPAEGPEPPLDLLTEAVAADLHCKDTGYNDAAGASWDRTCEAFGSVLLWHTERTARHVVSFVTVLGLKGRALEQRLVVASRNRTYSFAGPIVDTAELAAARICPTCCSSFDEGLIIRKHLLHFLHPENDESPADCEFTIRLEVRAMAGMY